MFIGVINLTCLNEFMQEGSGKNKQGSNTMTSQIRRSGYTLERQWRKPLALNSPSLFCALSEWGVARSKCYKRAKSGLIPFLRSYRDVSDKEFMSCQHR